MDSPPNSPKWLQWAWKEIGKKETPPNRGPVVAGYIAAGKCGELGDPWCAIFANAALESSGFPGTRSPSSQSFRHDSDFVQLAGPALGAIAVFWRGSRQSGLGHVGFYVGERSGLVWTLGGNENDMVEIEFLNTDAASFGLIGYWWPKTAPMPAVGPIPVDPSIPTHSVTVSVV
jgi:uncharacterized protein (TIGR02594 family)